VRVAALADLHCGAGGSAEMRGILHGVEGAADVLVLGGDLTNLGLTEEGEALLEALAAVRIPVVAVLGNHDHESGQAEQLTRLLTDGGVRLLEGSAWEYRGVGFAGVKGFGAGFTPHRLAAFGEAAVKAFVEVAVREAAGLDHALACLQTPHRVVVLHYSPIAATLAGEPPEIFPFLGDSLLEEVLDRRGADVAVHGHAHAGVLEGFTDGGIRVLNVSRAVLLREPGAPSYVTFDVPDGG
jgi:Icc-related predicted phosphoesterase